MFYWDSISRDEKRHRGAPLDWLEESSDKMSSGLQAVRLRSLLLGSATNTAPSRVMPRRRIKWPELVKCPLVIRATKR